MKWNNDFYSSDLVNKVLEGSLNYFKVVDFLIKEGRLTKDKIIFDQCCGRGRVSLLLRSKGIETISLDYNKESIKFLKDKLDELNFNSENVIEENATNFICNPKVDIGINWFTSFGHMLSEEENYLLIKNMHDSLKENGEFYLECLNSHNLIKNFKPIMNYSVDGITVERRSTFDIQSSILFQSWTIEKDGCIENYETNLRVYSPTEIKIMMEKAGFKQFWFFSDIDKNMLQIDSPRLIIIARK